MSPGARRIASVSLVVALAVACLAALRPAFRVFPLEPLAFPSGGTPGQTTGYRLVPADPPAGGPVDFRHYPTAEEIEEFCRQLAGAYPDLVRLTEVGRSYEGRPILALRLGSTATGDPDSRPALELDGQHHAREPVGQQAALYTAWHLASQYGRDPLATHLLDTRTLYVLPCVNPDGNEIFLNQHWAQRKNARPGDDDGDGRQDEDPYNGVHGWDVVEVVELTFGRQWLAEHSGNPFSPGWAYAITRRNNIGFYDLSASKYVPQVDDDRDGKVNEDLLGGVDLNRNYPGGWIYCSNQPASLVYRGTEPFSEPETRAVRDLVVAHPNIRLAVSYHSGDDRLAIPGLAGARLTADERLLERVGIKTSALTESEGYRGTRHQYGTGLAPGETRVWLYERGIIAWLVEAYAQDGPVGWTWSDESAGRVLAYFHTGLRFNPPPEGLLSVCRRWLGFNLYLLAAVPCPRVGVPSLSDGTLQLPVFNDGLVPVQVTVEAAVGERTLGRWALGELGACGVTIHRRLDGQTLAELSDPRGDPLTVTIVAGGPSREYPAPPLTSSWIWRPGGEGSSTPIPGWPRTLAGPPPGPFVSLGDAFGPGGWDAEPERWDTDGYHLSNYVRPPQRVP